MANYTHLGISRYELFCIMEKFANANGLECFYSDLMNDAAWIATHSEKWVRMFSARESTCGTNFANCEGFIECFMESSTKRALITHRGNGEYDFVEID